jgi:predicted alpha/beta-hydrolase family hydrolase
MVEQIANGLVKGYLHSPDSHSNVALVLAHGAGSDGDSRLLAALAEAFALAAVSVLRIHLPFRQERPKGPPHPSLAARDRAGIAEAAGLMRQKGFARVYVGGHSYGGRQASMLAAEDAQLASALLLLSYPLHPPRKPEQLRTAHFPVLRTPCLFVHGTKDPFGTPEEMRSALPSKAELLMLEGAAHELKPAVAHPSRVVDVFLDYCFRVGA